MTAAAAAAGAGRGVPLGSGFDVVSRAAVRLGPVVAGSDLRRGLAVGVAVAAAILVLAVPANLAASPEPIRIATVAIGVLFVGAGVIGATYRPDSPVGPLLVVAGSLYLVGRLQGADPPSAWLIANLANSGWQVIVFYVYFSFPVGRLRTGMDVFLVLAGLVYTTSNNLFVLITTPTRPAPGLSPANPFFLDLDPGLSTLVRQVLLFAGYVLIIGGLAWLLRRWLRASGPTRRALTPVYFAAFVTSFVSLFLRLILGVVSPTTNTSQLLSVALLLAFALVPLAVLLGLLRARMARSSIAELVVELGDLPEAGRLRDSLSKALGDPGLRLLRWVPERHCYVDPEGTERPLPVSDSEQAVTVLERDGSAMMAIVHDPSLLDDPGLVPAVATAVRLTIDNQRLTDEVESRLEEVRASRARMVDASDAARRQVERDLHDGAQQRLLAISLALRMTRDQLTPEVAADLGPRLDELTAQLGAALAELRELAHGIHPAILTESGLAAALRSIATASPIPVDVDVELPARRPSPTTESTAYFVAAEGLANAIKHAGASRIRISAIVREGRLLVEVSDDGCGGAVINGSGIAGLRDRVAAIDGRLDVTSPRHGGTAVRANLPCA